MCNKNWNSVNKHDICQQKKFIIFQLKFTYTNTVVVSFYCKHEHKIRLWYFSGCHFDEIDEQWAVNTTISCLLTVSTNINRRVSL